MNMPNGFTYMTDEEKNMLGKIEKKPNKILELSNCPSEEFLLTAVFLCPSIIRFVHNQSWWLRMIAVTLDAQNKKYVNGMTNEIRRAADSHANIIDLNMPHYLLEIYANAHNFKKYGIISPLNKGLGH